MPDWLVNLIIGTFSVILGFVSGFFIKGVVIKNKMKSNGNNNKQSFEVKNNGSKE